MDEDRAADAGPTQDDGPADADQGTEDLSVRRAPLRRSWVIKMFLIGLALAAFGGYGLYDANWAYPARGERYASFAEWQYLRSLNKAEAEDFGIFTREASVTDPGNALAGLEDEEMRRRLGDATADPTSTNHLRATAQVARRDWLKGLQTIGQMRAERTTIANPRERLQSLETRWASEGSIPKPLAFYDLPVQWLIVVVCWFITLWMIVLFVRTAVKRYSWDPGEKRLTIPGGVSLVPGDLTEVDKRKWDKFIIFLRVRADHPECGGRELRFDTYRHAELEGWILKMEEAAFGPQEDAGSGAGSEAPETGEDEPEPAEEKSA